MKSRYWIALLIVIVAVCGGLSIWLLGPAEDAQSVEVWSDGQLLYTLPLSVDQQLQIRSENGINVITIVDGKIAVTEADCPDHYCMNRGYCSGGTQIVCLPNRLVIKFMNQQEIDGVVG